MYIAEHNGAPTFFHNEKPVAPMLFWSREPEWEECGAFYAAGIRLFSFFHSAQHYRAPWWTGPDRYDFSRFDIVLKTFHDKFPDAFCFPRVFVCAPDWWLKQHPDEICGFAEAESPPTGYEGVWQGTFHESFASELWKKEAGGAFRALVRHLREAPYSGCIAGIHICSGITGEWHLWNPLRIPDSSPAMAKRFGMPVPPPEKRGADYQRCLHGATVEAIDHFCSIVKEESGFLTSVFYGYIPDMDWRCEGDHRAQDRFFRLRSVDIVSAPHSYWRRGIGRDAYFRSYPASLALHGKLFIDEGDDRMHCVPEQYRDPDAAKTRWESVQILLREFGNMLTHNIGMWYMSLFTGNFSDPELVAVIDGLLPWLKKSLACSRERASEVAVIASPEGEFDLPPRGTPGNTGHAYLFNQQLGELCRAGAPFDFYTSGDLGSSVMERYKMILILDGAALSPVERERLAELAPERLIHSVEGPFESTTALRDLYRETGVHIYSETDDVFQCSATSIMIHASAAGRKTIRLPSPADVFEISGGRSLGVRDKIEFEMEFGETRLFFLCQE